MVIRFTPDADAGLAEARQWYAHYRADLDFEYIEYIHDALSRVVRNPNLYPHCLEKLSDGLLLGVFRSLYFMKLRTMSFRS